VVHAAAAVAGRLVAQVQVVVFLVEGQTDHADGQVTVLAPGAPLPTARSFPPP
jgi:hypothetical protein